MKKYGLIGYPLGHSFSKGYFTEKFEREGMADCEYNNYPIDHIERFPEVLEKEPDLKGLNVTIPYKEAVIPYLDELDPVAAQISAVNVIHISSDKKLTGFNSDAYGFQQSLKPLLGPEHRKALVLGSGGAAKAVLYVLNAMGLDILQVGREAGRDKIAYDQLDERIMKEHLVIINTTPLGMYPEVSACPPIPYQFTGPGHIFFDLIYNPEVTQFMQHGLERHAVAKNGLEMLRLQAEKAWEIWTKNPR
ncbi:MAG: shikimate dehydrogenase [Flavobacteriales bacterium]|nr:shikimate dehydrogenase [Flavobacteriales bacterium]